MLFDQYFTVEDYLEERLQQWAKWCNSKNEDEKLNYPRQAVIYRMLKEGYFIPKKRYKNGRKPMEPHLYAEEVENLINRMARESLTYQKSAMVIREYYIVKSKKGSKPKVLGLTPSQFRDLFITGKSWLIARLSIKFDSLYHV